jgi:phenylacetate-CoA ligase
MKPPAWNFLPGIPGVLWPALPAPGAAAVIALLAQLDRSQWLEPEQLRARQLRQLEALLGHAYESVPYYRERWQGCFDPHAPLAPEGIARLPLLRRRDLQENYAALASTRVPREHGNAAEARTSGSTGAPVRFLRTPLCGALWNAITLRDHAWHGRDFGRKLAVIRQGVERGEAASWGPATVGIVTTGAAVMLPVKESVEAQLDWLQEQRPGYLLTYPSNIIEIARTARARGIRLPELVEVRAFGEAMSDEVREACRAAWDVRVTDMYSAEEVGYVALQCPEHEHYHVQSEGVWLEVLDAQGEPCAPGEVGRIVVTSLHNFATPLVRYDIGDYAEVGEPCACGRGLPVLRRILGRTRNLLVTSDGRRYWQTFGMRPAMDVVSILQHQFVQKSYDLIEARFVVRGPLTREQEAKLQEMMLSRLPAGFRIEIVYVDRIPRGAGGKFEEFVSEVTDASR